MILNDRYEYDPKKDQLGKGGFGTVYKAQDLQENRAVALKFVQKNKLPERYSLYNEILRIIKLDHPNLVKYFDAFKKDYQNVVGEAEEMHVGVMEYVNGGDLGVYLRKDSKEKNLDTYDILKGILDGLAYLHAHKIIHRDIKPQNILLQMEGEKCIPKIADFSISKEISGELTSVSATVGTYEYMSPEQLGKVDEKLGLSTDVWSFGVLAYQMLKGELPFGSRRKGDSDGQIIANILSKDREVVLDDLPTPFRGIIEKCLRKEPLLRYQQVSDIIKDLEADPDAREKTKMIVPVKGKSNKPTRPEETIIQEGGDFELITKTGLPQLPSDILASPAAGFSEATDNQQALSMAAISQPSKDPAAFSGEQTPQDNSSKKKAPTQRSASQKAMLLVILILAAFASYLIYDMMASPNAQGQATEASLFNLKEKSDQENKEEQVENPEGSLVEETNQPSVIAERSDEPVEPNTNTENEQPFSPNEDAGWEVEVEIKNRSENKKNPNPPKPESRPEKSDDAQVVIKRKEEKRKRKDEIRASSGKNSYDYIEEYPNGNIVARNNKYGYTDKKWNELIKPQYENFANFSEGLAAVKKGGKWGFIDKFNDLIIPYKYERPGVFINGEAQVTKDGKDFYINRRGKCVRECY